MLTKRGRQNSAQAAQTLLFGTVAYSAMSHLVTTAYQAFVRDEDDESWDTFWEEATDPVNITNALLTEHLRGLPVVGPALSYGIGTGLNRLAGERAVPTFSSSENPLMRFTSGSYGAGGRLMEAETVEEGVDASIDLMQAIFSLHPNTAIFAQGSNVAEDVLGIVESNTELELSEEDRLRETVALVRRKRDELYLEEREALKTAKAEGDRETVQAIERRRRNGLKAILLEERAEGDPTWWEKVKPRLQEDGLTPNGLDEEV